MPSTLLKVRTTSGIPLPYYTDFHARVNLNGVLAQADRHNDGNPSNGTERLGSRVMGFARTGSSIFLWYLSVNGIDPVILAGSAH